MLIPSGSRYDDRVVGDLANVNLDGEVLPENFRLVERQQLLSPGNLVCDALATGL
jgi:hypothetical protein